MKREDFREMIQPLSEAEAEHKMYNSGAKAMARTFQRDYSKDSRGYYVLTNKDMIAAYTDGTKEINNALLHVTLNEQLRLLVHKRYSVIPFHYTEFIGINYVYSGHLKLKFEDETLVLEEGQLVLMNSNVVHSLEIESENDIILGIQIEREFITQDLLHGLSEQGPVMEFLVNTLLGKESGFTYLITSDQNDEKLKTLFEDLFCEYLSPSFCSSELVICYMRILFIKLMKHPSSSIKMSTHSDILALLNYIEDHASDCTLQEMGDRFGFSPKYLSSLIKKKTGKSFSEQLLEARLRSVRNYLSSTSIPIADLAEQCGFNNKNFFYQKFKKAFGMTPNEYREQQRRSH